MTALRVVLVAEEAAGKRVLRFLRGASGVEVVAVLASRSRHDDSGSMWAAAEAAGCRVIPAERVKEPELAAELAEEGVDLLLNVHSLHLVHPSVLEVPRLGAYNLHPGPLPEMAGLDVPSWAILRGHTHHGVTLHRMAAGIDDGAVAFEDRFPIAAGATGLALSLECVRRGVPLVQRLVQAAERGEPIPARKQDLSCRRYFARRPPDGGSISFSKGAADVDAHLRAADYRPFASPWGHPRVGSECGEVRLLSAEACVGTGRTSARPGTVRLTSGGRALVACSDGWIALATVLLEGQPHPAIDVLRDGEVLRPLAS